ncbi:hypothetical protein SPRG_12352 [Saprolegnia parasitica CBS 223.65]|uniref:Uncharacterized protein n=1 Tax=Saprolegnia parasitica (strain CBS 223.65) TaxID=695850 RepID=A0A067C5M7_SAPPC|nr:hypothetical protein SPRG_12352 [Saprolegnia parasitica CBS 223.65]KDO21851.1 hypothetical protein SPRG_12352 [Saprolegnia parasitica CBS 223.65]|eukprot:XP_012207409.1 hypothetical protein SPRG_12352 [Saprolegnia parasitica CBS 223.65]
MVATTSSLLDQAHDGDAGAIASLLADVKLHGLTPEVAGPSLLVLAARAGDLEAVDSLLAVGLNVNAIVAQDTTPLITAVQSEHTEIVRSLLRHGADPNVVPPSGFTALQEACRHGLTDIVTALLEHGADTEACADDDGVTALCYTFDANDVESARVLHDFRANANVMLYGMPLFLLAVDVHSVDFAKLLVETYGVDVNQVDRNGNTALMLATRRGWDDLVTYLAPRCNVNAVAAHGYSAVAIAAAAGNLALVHALYSVGAHLAPSKPVCDVCNLAY